MTPTLSIAIVLYNSAEGLEDCLRSIKDAVDSGWAEVIAVDNASPDESVEVVRREMPEAKLIRLAENRGFAAGVNAALGTASGRYWLLLNPDVRVPAGGLEALVEWMDARKSLWAVSPEIYGEDGHWESPGRAAPSIIRAALELSRLHRLLSKRLRGRVLRGPYWLGGDQLDVDWVPGTAMMVRPEAIRDVGLLCEELFMYGEDIEWCWRIRRAGGRIGVCASTRFVHATSASAMRSWGESEKERRIAVGIDAACRVMYGSVHARVLAGLTAAALALDAQSRGRSPAQRARARARARLWRELAVRR
jgi:N-acetylglucosaminyl-diphospho-decaprenol L-rhamnosyltransferase